MKVTGEQSTVLSFLRFSRNVSGQKLLVYHILILIQRGVKLYSWRRAKLKILNSAPGIEVPIFVIINIKLITSFTEPEALHDSTTKLQIMTVTSLDEMKLKISFSLLILLAEFPQDNIRSDFSFFFHDMYM